MLPATPRRRFRSDVCRHRSAICHSRSFFNNPGSTRTTISAFEARCSFRLNYGVFSLHVRHRAPLADFGLPVAPIQPRMDGGPMTDADGIRTRVLRHEKPACCRYTTASARVPESCFKTRVRDRLVFGLFKEVDPDEEKTGSRKSRSPTLCVRRRAVRRRTRSAGRCRLASRRFYRWKKKYAGPHVAEIRRFSAPLMTSVASVLFFELHFAIGRKMNTPSIAVLYQRLATCS